MGRLIYSLNVSLDGFVETPDHSLDWAVVDDELHTWFNDQARGVAASIYGRRMYELMAAYWPTATADPSASQPMRDFSGIWLATPKVVFSTTLTSVDWNSRLVRGDVGDVLAELRREVDGDIDLGGPTIAAEFVRRDLVDEYRLVVHPVVIGAGTPFFPALDRPLRLRPTESHRFESGVLYLGYAPVRTSEAG